MGKEAPSNLVHLWRLLILFQPQDRDKQPLQQTNSFLCAYLSTQYVVDVIC